jgi:hypothetical protein
LSASSWSASLPRCSPRRSHTISRSTTGAGRSCSHWPEYLPRTRSSQHASGGCRSSADTHETVERTLQRQPYASVRFQARPVLELASPKTKRGCNLGVPAPAHQSGAPKAACDRIGLTRTDTSVPCAWRPSGSSATQGGLGRVLQA